MIKSNDHFATTFRDFLKSDPVNKIPNSAKNIESFCMKSYKNTLSGLG